MTTTQGYLTADPPTGELETDADMDEFDAGPGPSQPRYGGPYGFGAYNDGPVGNESYGGFG